MTVMPFPYWGLDAWSWDDNSYGYFMCRICKQKFTMDTGEVYQEHRFNHNDIDLFQFYGMDRISLERKCAVRVK